MTDLFPDLHDPIPPLEAARRAYDKALADLAAAEQLLEDQGPEAQPVVETATHNYEQARRELMREEREAYRRL